LSLASITAQVVGVPTNLGHPPEMREQTIIFIENGAATTNDGLEMEVPRVGMMCSNEAMEVKIEWVE
jgi:hypothetical protein